MASLYELSAENMALQTIIEDNGGEITSDIEEAFFGNEAALLAKVDSYADIINYNKRREAICDEQVKFFTGLKKQYGNAQKRLRTRMYDVLVKRNQEKGERVLQGDFHRFSLDNTKPSIDVDEALFFDRFQTEMGEIKAKFAQYGITVEFKADKAALKDIYPQGSKITPAGVIWVTDATHLTMK